MGTRASIKVVGSGEEFFIYRGHDGYPETVMPDLANAAEKCGCISDAGHFCSVLFGMTYRPTARIQQYKMTTGKHGDESYCYTMIYDGFARKWVCTEGDTQ